MQQLEEEQNKLQQQVEAGQNIYVEQVSQVDSAAAANPPPYHSTPVSNTAPAPIVEPVSPGMI